MDIKDFLPIIGIAAGWMLAEASAFGKRAIERKRTIGKALSAIYFLFLEMVKLKTVQEQVKRLSKDVKEWERVRQLSFERHANQDAGFAERLQATVDSMGEYYPIEAYELRDVLNKYQFSKSKKLDAYTGDPSGYLSALNIYELDHLAYQHQLELIIRFLAFRQSKILWIRIQYDFWRLRQQVEDGDLVFLQQVKKKSKRQVGDKA